MLNRNPLCLNQAIKLTIDSVLSKTKLEKAKCVPMFFGFETNDILN